MSATWKTTSSNAPCEAIREVVGVINVEGLPFEIVRHPSARRVRLALDPATGRARLVVPRRAAVGKAVAWAQGKAGWLEAERARLPRARPFVDGAVIPFGDGELTIHWQPGASRLLCREEDRLVAAGSPDTLARRVDAWLRREALAILDRETREVACAAGVSVGKVAVGDPRGRWGSCAHDGTIRYSWRLILAPAWVRRATVAHEVAHRVHMNHGAAFHVLVDDLLGADATPARAWLRTHGAALHWVGRSS